jgi:DNA-binding GntR family transcriptional regulator
MRSVNTQESLTDQVARELRQAILTGDLIPGELYTASQLGEQLRVSRTPIREALRELARLGLVVIEKNRGMRVVPTSVESFIEVFQVRIMLEVPLAERAAALSTSNGHGSVTSAFEAFQSAAEAGDIDTVMRRDRDFHDSLLNCARNQRATTLVREQRDFVLSTGVGTVPESRTAMECFEDHIDIFEAFVAGDAPGTGEAMHRHIVHTTEMLLDQERRKRPEFAEIDIADEIGWLSRSTKHGR